MSSKKIFLVLGMAHAGTGVMARALKVFNAHLVSASTENKSSADSDIFLTISRSIYTRLGISSDGLQMIPAEDLDASLWDSLRVQAGYALNQPFSQYDNLVVNDPATTRALPFWHGVFMKMKVDDYYVISLRHPLVAARSYHQKTGMDIETGLLLWSVEMLQMVEASRGFKRIVVADERLLHEPLKQLDRIAAAFHLEKLNEAEALNLINHVLDDKLHRHIHTEHEISLSTASNPAALCQDIYECLLQVANDEISIDSVAFSERWQSIMNHYASLAPMYSYVDRLLERRKKLQQKLSSVHESWSWRLLMPLRWVDDYLRSRRRKKHLMRRAVTNDA